MYLTPTDPMLMIAARAISEGPRFTDAQRQARATAAATAIFALMPMDALQVMLAAQIVIQHFAVNDAYAELVATDATGKEAGRLRAAAASATRCMIGLRRELRLAKREALENEESAAPAETAKKREQASAVTDKPPETGGNPAANRPAAPSPKPEAAPSLRVEQEKRLAAMLARSDNTAPLVIAPRPGPVAPGEASRAQGA